MDRGKRPNAPCELTSLELFAGGGGLALGVAEAGFAHLAVVELAPVACKTLRTNASRLPIMDSWPVIECDVHDFDFSPFADRVSLLAAGAPCQPFSLGGKHRGHRDRRNLFPEVFRAVRETRPEAVIIENVRGLVRESFQPYFRYILANLELPNLAPRAGEDWVAHMARLLEARGTPDVEGPRYRVTYRVLNSADFGVPQHRQRVFIVALRDDLGLEWEWPETTHSREALDWAKADGSYWDDHGIARGEPDAATPPTLMPIYRTERWRTVRDALRGLPEPEDGIEHASILNHVGNPGAKTYPGHNGSPLDWPAKTLKAGDHGVPGGENMLRRPDGSVRYFTVREAARLQGFPDEYAFEGAWSVAYRQLGNAVPVPLARVVAERVRDLLSPAAVAQHVA